MSDKTKPETKPETKTFEVVLVRRVEYRTTCQITLPGAADDDEANVAIQNAIAMGWRPEETTGLDPSRFEPKGWEEVGTSEVAEDDEGWEIEEISELDVPGC